MSDSGSPLNRSIGLSNLIRGLIAMFAVIAIVTAFRERRIGLAVASVLFLAVAVPLAYWAWRCRESAAERSSSPMDT